MSDWRSRAEPVFQGQPIPALDATQVASAEQPQASPATPLTPDQNAAAQDWRTRATPVANDWKSRATPVDNSQVDTQPKNFLQKVGQDYENRNKQMQTSADKAVAGTISVPEALVSTAFANAGKFSDTIGEALSSVTPKPVKDAIAGGVKAIGSLPSLSGRTIGEDIPNELSAIAQAHPRLATDARTVYDAVNLIPAAKTADIAAQLGSGARSIIGETGDKIATLKENLNSERTPIKVPGSEDLAKISGENFDTADYLGAKFTPNEVANKFESTIQQQMPKPLPNGEHTTEGKAFISALKEFQGNTGKDFSLEDVNNIDQQLGQKITKSFIDPSTGAPDANGRKLMILQQSLRNFVDSADTAGNDALVNGRTTWAAKIKVRDLEDIAERASAAANPETATQSGYRALYNTVVKTNGRGWSDDEIALLKKAATPGLGQKLIEPLTSKLTSLILGGTGNLPAAAGAQIAGIAARGVKGAVIAGRGAKVQQAIVDNALSKLRDVSIPEPQADIPLQLAAPGKLSKLPMSDAEIAIAKKQLNRQPNDTLDLSGGAVKPKANQSIKLEALPRIDKETLSGMSNQLNSGELSKSKFIEEARTVFKLNRQQARDLAEEILRKNK